MDIEKIPREKVEEVLQQYFDISLEKTNKVGLESLLCYRDDTDTYYIMGNVCRKVNIKKQYLDENGNINIEYTRGEEKYDEKGIAVLKLKGNRFVFLSNEKID